MTIKIAVDRSVIARTKAIAERLGMKEQEVHSRVYNAFADLPEPVQYMMLGLHPPGFEKDIAHLILERMKGEKSLKIAAKKGRKGDDTSHEIDSTDER